MVLGENKAFPAFGVHHEKQKFPDPFIGPMMKNILAQKQIPGGDLFAVVVKIQVAPSAVDMGKLASENAWGVNINSRVRFYFQLRTYEPIARSQIHNRTGARKGNQRIDGVKIGDGFDGIGTAPAPLPPYSFGIDGAENFKGVLFLL